MLLSYSVEKAVDLAFVIGASGAQASSVFARMVTILKNFVDEYAVSEDQTRVALVDYNRPAIAKVFFNDDYNKANFTSFVGSIPGPGGQPGPLWSITEQTHSNLESICFI